MSKLRPVDNLYLITYTFQDIFVGGALYDFSNEKFVPDSEKLINTGEVLIETYQWICIMFKA